MTALGADAPARILLVEDEQIVALELREHLVRTGYVVPAVAASAAEAIEAAEHLRPDLVMMDIHLQGGTDGIAAAQILKDRIDVPVVYLTAYADVDTMERAKRTGPYGYVLKPFRERELQVVIDTALHHHQAGRRQRLLADAGREVITAPDGDALLSRLTELLVRHLADWCVVHLRGDRDGAIRLDTFARAHATSSMPSLHVQFVSMDPRAPASTAAPPGSPASMWRRGSGTCVGRALEGLSTRDSVADEQAWITSLLGSSAEEFGASGLRASSFVCAPLFVRGRSLGALTIVAEHPDRRFGEADLQLVEEIGRLAGAGIDNARLHAFAQRTELAREEVLAIVAHDLRTPLAAIKMMDHLLLEPDGAARPDTVIARVQKIDRNVRYMDHLVNELVDFTMVASGHLSLSAAPHAIRALLDDAVALCDLTEAARSVRVFVDVAPEDGVVLCDRDRVLQALSNLVGNAVKLSPAGGAVRVGAHICGGTVQLHVSDEAGGIAPEHVPHVFERFWRAPGQARHGLGLGLHIARGIVEAHGGRIWVETTLGVGSTFYFTLPSAAPAGAQS